MITLNPADINVVNEDKLDETLEYKAGVLRLKPDKVEYSGRRKMKGGKSATRRVSQVASLLDITCWFKEQRKRGFYELNRQQLADQRRRIAQEVFHHDSDAETSTQPGVSEWSPLDRFVKKT